MPSRTTETSPTVAAALHESPAVAESIERIIEELRRAQSGIDAVRPPADEQAAARYRDLLKEAAEVRGRAKLFFDYCGSGVGNGPFVELADGSVKIDMIGGIGVHFFGHGDPDLVRIALRAAMSDLVLQGNLQMNADSTEFARYLVEQAGRSSRLSIAFLTNSGAMANEAALKVCYQKNAPASRVLAFENCFMGRSVTMSQIGDSAANRDGIPLSTLVDYIPFYDPQLGDASIEWSVRQLERFIERYPKQHAGFVFEIVQGEGGFNPAPREYFVALMETCRRHGIAVWIDEVQTFGRTLKMFAFEALELGEYVDVCTVGKLSQVCACLYTQEYNPRPGLLSGTFIGSTAAINTGLHIMRRLREGDYYGPDGRIAQHHQRFVAGMRDLAAKHPQCFGPIGDPHGTRLPEHGLPARAQRMDHVSHGLEGHAPGFDIVVGFGGMMRFTPFGGRKEPVMKLLHTLYDEGVIAFYCGHGPYHLRFLPPLGVMELEQWDAVFEVVERALVKTAS